MKKKKQYHEPYSVDELVESIIIEYDLFDDEEVRATYKAKLYRALHNTGIWDKGIEKGNGKKKQKYFSEQQKQKLLASPDLYDYVREHSKSQCIKESKRYKEVKQEIKERSDAHIAYLDSRTQDEWRGSDNAPYISQKEFRDCRNAIMLTAIFERFFTPINDSLLEHDLYAVMMEDELDITTEQIEAEQRLNSPEGNYYRRKSKS